MTMDELRKRREYLTQHLRWLGVRSTGSDRLERELDYINVQIARMASEEPDEGQLSMF